MTGNQDAPGINDDPAELAREQTRAALQQTDAAIKAGIGAGEQAAIAQQAADKMAKALLQAKGEIQMLRAELTAARAELRGYRSIERLLHAITPHVVAAPLPGGEHASD